MTNSTSPCSPNASSARVYSSAGILCVSNNAQQCPREPIGESFTADEVGHLIAAQLFQRRGVDAGRDCERVMGSKFETRLMKMPHSADGNFPHVVREA